jgi:hypothetical protein
MWPVLIGLKQRLRRRVMQSEHWIGIGKVQDYLVGQVDPCTNCSNSSMQADPIWEYLPIWSPFDQFSLYFAKIQFFFSLKNKNKKKIFLVYA